MPPENDPRSELRFMMGDYEWHWTARVVHSLVALWLKEWKWIIGAAVAIAAVIVNATR